MMLSIIVAFDRNRTIGKDNQLPWHLPRDLANFKKVTMGHPIVMGRKTYESIGRPLPGRENIILTRNRSYEADGCKIIHTIDDLRQIKQQYNDELFILGGAEIFKEVLPEVDRLYVTYIDAEFVGDTFFPEVDLNEWKEISREKGIKDENNPYDYEFIVYERRQSE